MYSFHILNNSKGNSGGPVFNTHKEVIGVAFQSLSEEDTENIGKINNYIC